MLQHQLNVFTGLIIFIITATIIFNQMFGAYSWLIGLVIIALNWKQYIFPAILVFVLFDIFGG